jgi:hypothetical protein
MCSLFEKHIAISYEFLLLSFYLIKFSLEEDADTNQDRRNHRLALMPLVLFLFHISHVVDVDIMKKKQ